MTNCDSGNMYFGDRNSHLVLPDVRTLDNKAVVTIVIAHIQIICSIDMIFLFHHVQSLLSAQTAKEKESKKMTEEILQLLTAPTSKEKTLMERFKSQGGKQIHVI